MTPTTTRRPPLALGTARTLHGERWTVQAVGWVGERYYWLTNRLGVVSMMPADVVEDTDDRR